MSTYLGLLVLLLTGGVAAACVYVLLQACEEITCAFGPLDTRSGAHAHAATLVDGQPVWAEIAEPAFAYSALRTRSSSGERNAQRRLLRGI